MPGRLIRVRRDHPDPYFFPEPGPDPEQYVSGTGIGNPNPSTTGPGSGRDTAIRDLSN